MSHNRYILNVDNKDIIRQSLKLLNVGSARYGGDWHSVPHTHSYAELFYVVSGKGLFQIDSEQYPVSAHQMIIVNPNVAHTELSYHASPLEYIVLGIAGLEFSSNKTEENRFQILNYQNGGSILTCLRNILQETGDALPGFETICRAYMEILIVRLMRDTNFRLISDPTPASSSQCATVRRYIDNHFKEPLTLEHLADIAHVNKYYLAHSFKEEFGISPISYLLNRRIEESCYLLLQTDMSLSQIARILGFSSSSYFSQLFRKTKKISPSDYRKLSKTDALPMKAIYEKESHQ
ncbi:MAG: AraC family transcriptional regulator [Oscillospiraceae bacterium]|nr:AraC family transcriptional regulator [Oscillospiraceae bacterium]